MTEGSTALVRYDAMCRAISECHGVDEIKGLRDQAAALQHYARMAGNHDAERQCAEIRLRAERRAGELLLQMDKAKGGRPSKTGSVVEPVSTLEALGVTRKQSSTWQQLAGLPQHQFEAALSHETSRLPTAHGIIDEAHRQDLEASLNRLYAGLTPEEVKAEFSGKLPPGAEAALWRMANMDAVTGARPSGPKPSVATLMEADRALGDFLERFTGPGFEKGSRVRRRVEEARGVVNYMLAEITGRH